MSLLIDVGPEEERAPDDGALFVDRRVLAFRAPALCEILTTVWLDGGTGMQARAIHFLTAGQILRVEVDLNGRLSQRSLRANELLPLLIAWCIGSRIALPSQAEKAVHITSGGAVLDCGITHFSLPRYRRKRLQEWAR